MSMSNFVAKKQMFGKRLVEEQGLADSPTAPGRCHGSDCGGADERGAERG